MPTQKPARPECAPNKEKWEDKLDTSGRKKATDFPQELLDLLDSYVHGRIGRREFLACAQKFATAAVSAAALFEMLAQLCLGTPGAGG